MDGRTVVSDRDFTRFKRDSRVNLRVRVLRSERVFRGTTGRDTEGEWVRESGGIIGEGPRGIELGS